LAKQTQDKTHEQEELAKMIATVAEANRLPEESKFPNHIVPFLILFPIFSSSTYEFHFCVV
jgi:hypothetical protein